MDNSATGSFDQSRMESLASMIGEMETEEAVRPFTEASTILQDYMDAWVMWHARPAAAGDEFLFTDYLFEVVARRAVFITENVQ
ncbi:MAG: hypothetical protein ACTSX2_12845 [Candidatus Thorarchaeota archaeon]